MVLCFGIARRPLWSRQRHITIRILYDLAELPDIAEQRGAISNPEAGTQKNCDWRATLLVGSVLFRCNRWAWNYFKCIGFITTPKKKLGNKICIFLLPAHREIKLLHRSVIGKHAKSLRSLPFPTWLLRFYSYQGGYRDLGQPMNAFQKVMNSDQKAIQPRWQRFDFRRPRSRDRRPEVNTSARLLTLTRRRCPFRCRTGCKISNFYLSGSYSTFNRHKIISIEK